ncbi:hypothetical protein H4P12_01435 [Paracoccus sp. 11-3]|uniref:Lipoprotein n=1 Tax=Paracoccus amoyensis TaxID=2760093 RepID=A0A926GBK9_9RHOB|nr:hypothetical protein [Paracoccus amoyensis]MBC9245401.1 hypothetical protein [Paracoccus amoyensis]
MIRQTANLLKATGGAKALAALCLLGLAACTTPTDRVPFNIDGRVYVVSGGNGGLVTGPVGASLSQADGLSADRAFHEYCRTQGRNGSAGTYAMLGSVGVWQYAGCRR